ncbi:putative phosphoribosyl transferase [Saccharopolyspora erythraea NRRL 2338]|uniref:Phosphoribosyltransferase n=2 Tax=Saccharopolyspora erythraea TaxID=1836 RepID=A4FCC3_SACEN|nr:alpha/beta fold hydrolase [Saccharopolyspora erythraea]EQD84984.1 phosphoribosyl transferase [Saccharopolyspora erythraea D]PFG95461.1 putative phosphoribosyl transferase [Saccharopolyspora erythraea NRRL 2338]QRK92094.1 dienelactone hydrolase family protein [Saccharopolyspora erythraea]CAM01698.1 phosphoribosyltransferase [Saccharopolyspora erythraea NRRL 2338]
MPFADRTDAGRRLARQLSHLQDEDVVVLGLPRGGVPVAFEVARALDAPLDVIVVRKLGVPFHPELGMGAIGEGDVRVINDEVVRRTGVRPDELAEVERRERIELDRRAQRFRRGRLREELPGRTAIVVDDGIATGSTAAVACRVARAQGATRVVLAVPVAPPSALAGLRNAVDELVCLETPEVFWAIGEWYADFAQTSDAEVVDLLDRAPRGRIPRSPTTRATDPDVLLRDEEVELATGVVRLAGHLSVPERSEGIVVFAHGSGSSRHSPRNRYVAIKLNRAGLGTLLFDLLAGTEEFDRRNVFDIELLASRLVEVTRWLHTQPEAQHRGVGYFGASTGAAAALWAAAEAPDLVKAVVSRGGRPDLAADRLAEVRTPTLLIVGGRDDAVLGLNRQAQARLRCESRLAVVPGATHLFEEEGALDQVAELARAWFTDHLMAVGRGA